MQKIFYFIKYKLCVNRQDLIIFFVLLDTAITKMIVQLRMIMAHINSKIGIGLKIRNTNEKIQNL